ncbi:MAG: ATP-grasp domain-containing protein [Nanoarchaeota archaeon]
MEKKVLGYILDGSPGNDEKIFEKIAKEKNIDLIFLNAKNDFEDKKIEEKIKKCDLIFNNSGERIIVEIEKTAEELGVKVIDSPKNGYFLDDKWTFFLECKKHNIPTPETVLLLDDIKLIEKELKLFNKWPVILKILDGCCGEFVVRAKDLKEAVEKIKEIWKKRGGRVPIIAQEFINGECYRVTIVGDEIVQAAQKMAKGWKKTSVYEKNPKKVHIKEDLEKVVKRFMKFNKIKVCGIDLLKKDDNWFLLEANSVPCFNFIADEKEKLIRKVFELLKKELNKIT